MEDQRSRRPADLLKRAAAAARTAPARGGGAALRGSAERPRPEHSAPAPSGFSAPAPSGPERSEPVARDGEGATEAECGPEPEARRSRGPGPEPEAAAREGEAAEQAPGEAQREGGGRRAAARATRARPAACQPVGPPRPRALGPRRRLRPGLGLPGPASARPRRTSQGASERRAPAGPRPGPARPGRRMTELQSALLLRRQLAELNKNPVEGFSAGLIDDNDLYRWEVLIIGPPDTLYEGGVFKAHLTFPKDYPLRPPKMKFITEIWHPNVDKNGDVCISILHEPGEDKYGYEKPEERWLPIHTVETIMISVISMLADPNGDSPANVDAAKEWREDRNGEFKRKVARCVRKSQETAFE
ncbi:ubiquitin-conjugating enzyme E2 G1 [Notamacropus eugenii]|uniref:ubiquitin-conjugating enzyme E2 G1 n=1 Tax=Notamacropus eugenii TaxID=9315 RepID=UPI003B66FD85